MIFWDSSAIIPLCIDEPRSKTMQKMVEEDSSMVAWWGTPVECFSAFARLRREDILSDAEEAQVIEIVNILLNSWTEIAPSQEIRDIASRLLRLHPLRAADAIQLSAAFIWAGKNPRGYHFACLDKRLREAAMKEGFILLPVEV